MEILVVIFIIATAASSLLGAPALSLKAFNLTKETVQADNLAQEAIEAVRNFRDGTTWATNGLGTLTTSVNYYPAKTGDTPPKWTLALGEETINGFTRKVVFEKVSRDAATKNIESPYNVSNDDPDTRKTIITVSWKDRKVELTAYFTNWK